MKKAVKILVIVAIVVLAFVMVGCFAPKNGII